MPSTSRPVTRQAAEQAVAHQQSTAQLEAAQAALLARYAPETRIRRVRWSQGETQVMEFGSGSPLVLVHGALASGFYWASILPALARDHHVFVVDLPGHGLADPFDYTDVSPLDHARTFLRDILNALGLDVTNVVANSMGGLWAVAFALGSPDRVSRLVLVGAPAGAARTIPIQLRMLGLPLIGQPLGRRLMSRASRESNRKLWGQILVVHPEQLDDTLLDADIAHSHRNVSSLLSLTSRVVTIRGLRRHLILGERWQKLMAPTLFLWGECDAFTAPEMGEAIAARNPNLRITRVPDAGHLPWLDNPERIVNEIERFLTI